MGTQGVFPNKAMGGVSFVQHSYGHVFLMGKARARARARARVPHGQGVLGDAAPARQQRL
jgi:hypothetical protein